MNNLFLPYFTELVFMELFGKQHTHHVHETDLGLQSYLQVITIKVRLVYGTEIAVTLCQHCHSRYCAQFLNQL